MMLRALHILFHLVPSNPDGAQSYVRLHTVMHTGHEAELDYEVRSDPKPTCPGVLEISLLLLFLVHFTGLVLFCGAEPRAEMASNRGSPSWTPLLPLCPCKPEHPQLRTPEHDPAEAGSPSTWPWAEAGLLSC